MALADFGVHVIIYASFCALYISDFASTIVGLFYLPKSFLQLFHAVYQFFK